MIDSRSLWTAVLRQAIFDLTGLRLRMKSAYRPGQRAAKATSHPARYFARLWFLSDNHKPCSFKLTCDHLELDASWLRRRLFEIVDGYPYVADKIPIQLEALLAEEYDEEESGPQPPAAVYTRATS